MNTLVDTNSMYTRVSKFQQNTLINFIQKHPVLNQSSALCESKSIVKKLWTQLAVKLNADANGSCKDPYHWKRYWINLKHKVKTKTLLFNRERKAGNVTRTRFSEQDKKILATISKRGKIYTRNGEKIHLPDAQDWGEEHETDRTETVEHDGADDLPDEITEEVEKTSQNTVQEKDIETIHPAQKDSSKDNEVNEPILKRKQLEVLVKLMERYPVMAHYRRDSGHDWDLILKNWEQIGRALNKVDPTRRKSGHGWLKYWTMLKTTVRTRYEVAKRDVASGLKDSALEEFSPTQLRILNIITTAHEEDKVLMYDDDDVAEVQPTEQVDVKDALVMKVEYPEDDFEEQKNRLEDYEQPLEDPIDTTVKPKREETTKTKEDIRTELLRFQLEQQKERHRLELARQKEMHELQMRHQIEKHALEMEILEFKKKKLLLEYNRNKKLHKTVQQFNNEN